MVLIIIFLTGCIEEQPIADPDDIQGDMRDYITEFVVLMKYRYEYFLDFVESNDDPALIQEDSGYYRSWFIASNALTTPPRNYSLDVQAYLDKMYDWSYEGNMYRLLSGKELNEEAMLEFEAGYLQYKEELGIDSVLEQTLLEVLLNSYDNTNENLSSIAIDYYVSIKENDFQKAYNFLSTDAKASISEEDFIRFEQERFASKQIEITDIEFLSTEDDTARSFYVRLLVNEVSIDGARSYIVNIPLVWTKNIGWLVEHHKIFEE